MVTCSSILTWRIPRTEEPGGLVYRVTKGRTRLKRLNTHARVWFKPPFLIPVFFFLKLLSHSIKSYHLSVPSH